MPRISYVPPSIHVYRRTILDSLTQLGDITSGTMVLVGQVFCCPVEIPVTLTVDAIGWMNATTITGNFRAGIYRDGAAGDTPAGGALVVESASVAGAGVNRKQEASIAATRLIPGLYWLVLQGDQAADTVYEMRLPTQTGGTLSGYIFQNAGAYAAFENPQASALTVSQGKSMYVLVSSIP